MSLRHQHRRAERLLVAQVSGAVAKHAARRPLDVDAAVAELHAITTDPHLLGHAWRWPEDEKIFPDPWRDAVNTILGAAGADPQHPTRVTTMSYRAEPGGVPDSGRPADGLTYTG